MAYQAEIKMDRHGLMIDGVAIIAMQQATHPEDEYLYVVLAENPSKQTTQYVTWVYNAECGGFHYGNYFDNFTEALKDFDIRKEEYTREYTEGYTGKHAQRPERVADYNREKVTSMEDYR